MAGMLGFWRCCAGNTVIGRWLVLLDSDGYHIIRGELYA